MDFPASVLSFTLTRYRVEEKIGVLSLESSTRMDRGIEVLPKPLEATRVQLYKLATSRSRMSISSIIPGEVWSNDYIILPCYS